MDIPTRILVIFFLKAGEFQIHRANMQAIQMIYLITENVGPHYNREYKAILHITANNSASNDVNQKQNCSYNTTLQGYCAPYLRTKG